MSTGTDLGSFEGRTVTRTTIAVKNAGDGLSQALKIEPQLLHQGDTVYVVLECVVGPIKFDPYADDVCSRVQELRAGAATIIDADVVRSAIEDQKERIRVAEDAEKGVRELPTDEALAREHRAGLHEHDEPSDHPECKLCNPED